MTDPEPHVDDERLRAYGEGTLPQAEAREVERHVARCADCRRRLSSALGRKPPAPADDEADENGRDALVHHSAPPSLELPETSQIESIPSQVSVMSVPTTLEGAALPSHTSVTTGIGPSHRKRARKRARRTRRLRGAALLALAAMIGITALAALYVFGLRPRARSGHATDQAMETLEPVLRNCRLADLQHPALRGATPYLPGADPALEERVVRAEAELLAAVEADGGNRDARLLLALTHLLQGDPRVARLQLQELEAQAGPTPETELGLGILDFRAAGVANDPDDRAYALERADQHFQRVQLGDPGYAHALYNRAAVALSRGDHDEAQRLLEVYAELQPESPWTAELTARLARDG